MLNIQGLMKQAQMMQKKMQEEQEKLAKQEVEGSAANGMLTVMLNGKSEMKKISKSFWTLLRVTELQSLLFI